MSTGPTLPLSPLVDPNVAVLWSVPQDPPVVALTTCSVMVAPAASVKVPVVAGSVPQLKVSVGGEPPTAHAMPLGIEVPVPESDQLMPVPAGRLSDSVTPVASPAPVLLSVTT